MRVPIMLRFPKRCSRFAMRSFIRRERSCRFSRPAERLLRLGSERSRVRDQGVFYAVRFCFIALHWRRVFVGALNAKWILACSCCICFYRMVPGPDDHVEARRSPGATTAFGVYFATRFDIVTITVTRVTCGLVVCVSFLCAIFLPQYESSYVPLWRLQGAFYQKKHAGRAMVLATLVFLFARGFHQPILSDV